VVRIVIFILEVVIADVVSSGYSSIFGGYGGFCGMLVSVVGADNGYSKGCGFAVNFNNSCVTVFIMGDQLIGAVPAAVFAPDPDFTLEW
jgi:Na+-translocating ferredoxin:NAD+ oxidoreductase RnfD subunit